MAEVEGPGARLFALLIGISKYASDEYSDLYGAVSDAEAVKRYLREALQVPEENIHTLYDAQATRGAIIEAFKALRNNPQIGTGDPIVIFYAGHGDRLAAPEAWASKKVIECLVPHDCGATEPISDQEPIPDRKPIPGCEPIPDRTIGALIEDIAEAKGNNITVIFDCCHSGSGTRDRDEEYVARSVETYLEIPEALDADIWAGRLRTITGDSPRSHVLLAACREDELAWEHPKTKRGQFTTALLKALKNCAEKNELALVTYAELVSQIRLRQYNPQYMQHPRSEGFYRHRPLFNGRVSDDVYYAVVRKGDKYVISAGLAHGVSHDAEFTLYDDKRKELSVIWIDKASSVEDFKTTVMASARFAGVSLATLSGVGKLPLSVDEEILPSLNGCGSNIFRRVQVGEAKLEVRMHDSWFLLTVLDSERYERGRRFGLTRLTHKVTPDDIGQVLRSAAHYYWFLDFAKEHDRGAKYEVDVDFFLLDVSYDDLGDPILTPRNPGFCEKDPSNRDVIDFPVDPDAYYGIEIKNKTQYDLYMNVFLFNDSSWSIVRYYTLSTTNKRRAPLKKGETFTIGYGTTCTAPLTYTLDEGQNVDVGFLKIFFTTQPIDLSDIAQPSPFSGARDEDDEGSKSGRWIGVARALSKWLPHIRKAESDLWFTVDIPVVQRAAT